jgi:hypothetical protein
MSTELEKYQNWMMLAFRALNDAYGVIQTIVPESGAEEEKLGELRNRIADISAHVPALLGLKAISEMKP